MVSSKLPPRLEGTRHVTIQADSYGHEIQLLYPIPKDDNAWGVFACLRGTYYGDRIRLVSASAYSHALYGMSRYLRQGLGRPIQVEAQRVPDIFAYCAKLHNGTCAMGDRRCRPGTGQLPVCYWAPDSDRAIADAAASVALAWDEGRYVIVLEGDGFVV